MHRKNLEITTKLTDKASENNDLINFLDYNKQDPDYISIFDDKKKKISKNYSIFKSITSKKPLKLDPKEKIFQDKLYKIKSFSGDQNPVFVSISVFRWKNIKAKMIFFKVSFAFHKNTYNYY